VWLGVGAQCINGQWQGGKEPIIRDARHWGHCICGAIYADKRGTREARKVAKMAAPVFDSYKPNFTETVQGDAYPLKSHEDGYPKLPACLDRSFLSEPLAEAA
jgi:hypothetical protein